MHRRIHGGALIGDRGGLGLITSVEGGTVPEKLSL